MHSIGIFQRHPECSIQCVEGMRTALSTKYNIVTFTENEIATMDFSKFSVVSFPGGIGDSDSFYKYFTRRISNRIADYLGNGGKYLGICMGAYWAGHWYFDILDKIQVVQYIKQSNADVKRSFGTVANVNWNGQTSMYFYDGCTFVGNGKYKTLASYANGDPMAIIQSNIGLIGCHPESEESWYDKTYLKRHWHNGSHHKLLLEFVDELVGEVPERPKGAVC